jgi:glutamine synthetase
MHQRYQSIQEIARRQTEGKPRPLSVEDFGKHVFDSEAMRKMLPTDIFYNVSQAMQGLDRIKPEYADTIAVAM